MANPTKESQTHRRMEIKSSSELLRPQGVISLEMRPLKGRHESCYGNNQLPVKIVEYLHFIEEKIEAEKLKAFPRSTNLWSHNLNVLI